MFRDDQGPIECFEWGEFTISGTVHKKGAGAGKDIRLIGTEVSEWAERQGHILTPDMVTGVYGIGLEILVIGNGVDQLLDCPEGVRQEIASHGIPELRILATPGACRTYNELFRQGRRVALLAHGTC